MDLRHGNLAGDDRRQHVLQQRAIGIGAGFAAPPLLARRHHPGAFRAKGQPQAIAGVGRALEMIEHDFAVDRAGAGQRFDRRDELLPGAAHGSDGARLRPIGEAAARIDLFERRADQRGSRGGRERQHGAIRLRRQQAACVGSIGDHPDRPRRVHRPIPPPAPWRGRWRCRASVRRSGRRRRCGPLP